MVENVSILGGKYIDNFLRTLVNRICLLRNNVKILRLANVR